MNTLDGDPSQSNCSFELIYYLAWIIFYWGIFMEFVYACAKVRIYRKDKTTPFRHRKYEDLWPLTVIDLISLLTENVPKAVIQFRFVKTNVGFLETLTFIKSVFLIAA